MQRQRVAQQYHNAEDPQMLRLDEPEEAAAARRNDEEPILAVGRWTSEHHIVAPRERQRRNVLAAPLSLADQLAAILAGEQVAAIRIGQDHLALHHGSQPLDGFGQFLLAPVFVSVPRLAHLHPHQHPERGLALRVESQRRCHQYRRHGDDRGRQEPEQNFREQRSHPAASPEAVQNWYPTPRMVLISSRPASSFLRRWLTCMSMERSNGVALRLYMLSISVSREPTRPACRRRTSRMSNSSVVVATGWRSISTSRVPGSSVTPFTSIRPPTGLFSMRRRIARMRAASSRGLNGFER